MQYAVSESQFVISTICFLLYIQIKSHEYPRHIFCAYPIPGSGFPKPYVVIFMLLNCLRNEIVVRFVYTGRVDHHCVCFLFIIFFCNRQCIEKQLCDDDCMTIITLTLIYLAVSNIYYSYFYEIKKEGLLYHLKKLTSYLIVSNIYAIYTYTAICIR